jgi:hypothetical protein
MERRGKIGGGEEVERIDEKNKIMKVIYLQKREKKVRDGEGEIRVKSETE